MLDHLDLDQMRRRARRWQGSRVRSIAIFIMIGVVLSLIFLVQPPVNPANPQTSAGQQTRTIVVVALYIGLLGLIAAAAIPSIQFNRESAQSKATIAPLLTQQFSQFILTGNNDDLPAYQKSMMTLNSAGLDGKTLSQLLMAHDFESAQAAIDNMKGEFPHPDTSVPEALLYHMRGDFDQAEALYWLLLAGTWRRGHQVYISILLSNLADIRLQRRQFDQALSLIEQAITISPGYYHPYTLMIDYYVSLPDNPNPARAVQFAEAAAEVLPAKLRKPDNPFFQSITAFHALALAKDNQHERAKTVLAPLMPNIDSLLQTNTENVLTIARALDAMSDLNAARDLYAKISAHDPHGVLGRIATERLAALST